MVAVVISPDQYEGVIFDMDGVITDTASVHAAAWRRMFDEFLGSRTAGPHEDIRRFSPDDYREYVDGKPRYDGVAAFLAARQGAHRLGSFVNPSWACRSCSAAVNVNAAPHSTHVNCLSVYIARPR